MASHPGQWRDRITRVGDYLFGRNTLIGVASLMLLAISGYATWSGMSDFIVGVSSGNRAGREIVGGLSVTNEALVIAIVVTLTFLMWLSLRETFGRDRFFFRERLVTFVLYAFLALWSVGFGYGFWWSLIAGEEATRTSLSNLQEDARDASAVLAARLDAVKLQLDSVVSWSDGQMAREEASGGSCGVSSGAGRGPLYNARASVRDSVASLRDNIAQSWIAPVQADIENLKAAASRLEGGTVEERQARFEATAAAIRGNARSIAARSNSIGQSTASEMRALANAVSAKPGTSGFSCHDPTLAQRLRQAADQADKPAVLKLREAAFNEGPAGVANAVKSMWSKIAEFASFGLSGGSKKAEIAPFSGRDLIAFLATLGIDLGLFALTVLNPPVTPPNRNTLTPVEIARTRQAIRTAISSAEDDDKDVTLEWVRRHIIHHIGTESRWMSRGLHDKLHSDNTASFMVIPNLGSVPARVKSEDGSGPPKDAEAPPASSVPVQSADSNLGPAAAKSEPNNRREERRALALNQVAGVLTDNGLVRALNASELKVAQAEANREARTRMKVPSQDEANIPLNVGLLAKAHRALEMAGWSKDASDDPEIFRLVDSDGLLPLLTILSERGEPEPSDDGTNITAAKPPVPANTNE
ncbi:MAG: hypothetical protein ACR2PI_03960 [Hyphomicrobiaceae bacterium]